MKKLVRVRLWGSGLVMLLLAGIGVTMPLHLAGGTPHDLTEGTYYPNPPNDDRNMDALRSMVVQESVIGYAGGGSIDLRAINAFTGPYYAAQYVLAPTLLDPYSAHRLILMNMPYRSSDNLRRWVATSHVKVLSVIGRGRALVQATQP